MSCDPNADVRRAVLSCIAPCVQTLPAMLERTHDVKESVRRLAYQVLAEKVHMKALTIAQRIRLLQDGLNDRAGRCVREISGYVSSMTCKIIAVLGHGGIPFNGARSSFTL